MRFDSQALLTRRHFLQQALAAGAAGSAGLIPSLGLAQSSGGFAAVSRPVLAPIMLNGGPDMRHLLPPTPDTEFGAAHWQARAAAHGIAASQSAINQRFNNDYLRVDAGALGSDDPAFGIRSSCGWLHDQYLAGNVALINNTFGGDTRDHAHCILIMDKGDRSTGPNDLEGSGWGGRLAAASQTNVLSLNDTPRRFCLTPAPGGLSSNERVIPANDMRSMSLYRATENRDATWNRPAKISRAVRGYYAAQRQEMAQTSPFRRFIDLEQTIRNFGDPVTERLSGIALPAQLAALADREASPLSSTGFGQQMMNLHDALACNDILNMQIASMEYNGWDSHRGQIGLIEPKLADLFGRGMALDTLYQNLPTDAAQNLVLVLMGEFGRQLKANGDNGTDHGTGNTMIVIGQRVRGGLYGNPYPQAELSRLDERSPDIDGLTAFDHPLAALADWVSPGAAATVFPQQTLAPLEAGVRFNQLVS